MAFKTKKDVYFIELSEIDAENEKAHTKKNKKT